LRLNCRGPTGIIECDAFGQMPQSFKIVGLGPIVEAERRIKLLPLRVDNTAWLDSDNRVDNTDVRFSLYPTTSSITDSGLRIKSDECYDRLVGMIRQSSDSLQVPVLDKNGQRTKVGLFGEIFWFDLAL